MKYTANNLVILLLIFCFLPSFVGVARADIVPLQSSYPREILLPLGKTSVEKLYHTNKVTKSRNINQQIAVNQGQIVTKKLPVAYTSSTYQAKPIKTTHSYKEVSPINRTYTRKTFSPFSNNSYTTQPMDFPPRPFNRYTATVATPMASNAEIAAPFANTTTPVLYASDNDDDDYWNPGGTSGDNSGDLGDPVPVNNALLFLCLLALLYAVSKYFHTKQSTTEK